MYKTISTLIILLFSFNSFAEIHSEKVLEKDLFCAFKEAQRVKDELGVEFSKDKYLHCTVSCAVGNVCGVGPSAMLGIAKEIYDVFGPGHAELKDLVANFRGLRLSKKDQINDLKSCAIACQNIYPY
jgi:hypothetical protein